MKISAPDLTQRPPRSPRVRLGGYALLPRMLDKGRAAINGTNGEFNYNCPLDQHILNFLGVDPEALKNQLATGKGDGEILQWIEFRLGARQCQQLIAQMHGAVGRGLHQQNGLAHVIRDRRLVEPEPAERHHPERHRVRQGYGRPGRGRGVRRPLDRADHAAGG